MLSRAQVDYFPRHLVYGSNLYVSKMYLIAFGSQAYFAGIKIAFGCHVNFLAVDGENRGTPYLFPLLVVGNWVWYIFR